VFAYLLAAVVLLPLGIAVLVSSLNIQEHKVCYRPAVLRTSQRCDNPVISHVVGCTVQVRYDNAGIFASLPNNDARSAALLQNNGNGEVVTVNFTPDKKMSAPVSADQSAACRNAQAGQHSNASPVQHATLQQPKSTTVCPVEQVYVYFDLDDYYQNYRRCASCTPF
jgi:hypothetical protein